MVEATREKEVMEKLELKVRPLTKELRYYFTGHTTVEPNSDFIVFNIRELMNSDANIRNALFFNILKHAWGLCLDKDTNTILMVDEAHTLLADRNTLGAEFLAQVQRRSRKYNTGTIIITHKDRFIRFGFDWFEKFLNKFGVKFIIVNNESLSPQEELVQDIISILHVFSCRIYGLRKYKKKIKEDIEVEKSIQNRDKANTKADRKN